MLVKLQNRTVTVLLRPGRHYVKDAIHVEGVHRMVQISIETMQMPWQKRQHKVATLISNTGNRRDEPLIRVVKGEVQLKNVRLRHESVGTDIWNGNAAIQIRPRQRNRPSSSSPPSTGDAGTDDVAIQGFPKLPSASVHLAQVQVSSSSGRGIVTQDDGLLCMHDSCVHDCAATGVYVGGPYAQALLRDCDIVNNGTGNSHAIGGVSRRHSGIYVEKGMADLRRCSVAKNTSAGISVISSTEGLLKLSQCDVIANGGTPLELPLDSLDRHSIRDDNRVSVVGKSRAFSRSYQEYQSKLSQSRLAD